jgi:molecular chaperone HtpG
VLVPDREAELKRRVEADEAQERIASAALHLARLHTETIDGERTARLYVNVEAPAVAALLEARRRGADTRPATGLLRAVLALIAAGERGGARVDLEAALADIALAVRRLCAEEA